MALGGGGLAPSFLAVGSVLGCGGRDSGGRRAGGVLRGRGGGVRVEGAVVGGREGGGRVDGGGFAGVALLGLTTDTDVTGLTALWPLLLCDGAYFLFCIVTNTTIRTTAPGIRPKISSAPMIPPTIAPARNKKI